MNWSKFARTVLDFLAGVVATILILALVHAVLSLIWP